MAFDLDDEELKATRELNGIAKKDREYYSEKADKMFESLKYRKIIDTDIQEVYFYSERTSMYNELFERAVTFAKASKLVKVSHLISMAELEAINIKCKALGWI